MCRKEKVRKLFYRKNCFFTGNKLNSFNRSYTIDTGIPKSRSPCAVSKFITVHFASIAMSLQSLFKF